MKRLWVSGFLLVILLVLCGLGSYTTSGCCSSLSSQLNRLKSEIHQGNISTALAISQSLQRQWETEHRRLCIFMPHDDLAPVGETLSQLPALIRNGETGLLESRCDLVNAQLEQLAEGETFTLDNLL